MDFVNETDSLTLAAMISSPKYDEQLATPFRSRKPPHIQPQLNLANNQTQIHAIEEHVPISPASQTQNLQPNTLSLDATNTMQTNRTPSDSAPTPSNMHNNAPTPQSYGSSEATIIRIEETPQNAASQPASTTKRKALTKIYLVKTILRCLALLLGSIWILLMPRYDYSLIPVYAIIFFYQVSLILLDITWTFPVMGDSWSQSIQALKLVDALCGTMSIVMIYLKNKQIMRAYTYGSLPFIFDIFTAVWNSKGFPQCLSGFGLRIYYFIQVVLITFRLDGHIDWNWSSVFLPSLAYSVILNEHVVIFIISVKQKMRSLTQQNSNLPRQTRIIGISWHLVCYICFILPLFVTIIGIAQALTSKDNFKVLNIVAYCGIVINSILIIFSIAMWRHLMKFIVTYELVTINTTPARVGVEKAKPVSFEVEKKVEYFVKLSSTYFVPLKKSFSKKYQKNIKQIRNELQSLKLRKNSSNASNASTKTSIKDNSKSPSSSNKSMSEIELLDKEKKLYTEEKEFYGKIAYTTNDIENLSKLNLAEACQKENEDENLCGICYKNCSDAIMVNCGHGGLCYDCATTLIKQKDRCMVCRGKVEAIHKIDPCPRFSNIVKGIELSKVVIEA